MPIINKLLSLPKGNLPVRPALRKCALCHEFGAHAHGFYPRYPPGEGISAGREKILVPRFLCLHCSRTFSLLPFFLLRRIGMPLPMLLFIAGMKRRWETLLGHFGIARNTLWAWRRLGHALPEIITQVLALPEATWATLSSHISRWQYPNGLRKPVPTIP